MRNYRLKYDRSDDLVHVQVKSTFRWITLKSFKLEYSDFAIELYCMLKEDLDNIRDFQTAHDDLQHIVDAYLDVSDDDII